MKATELLKQQHAEVQTIFKQLLTSNGSARQNLSKLAENLSAHIVIEQELFYPALLAVKEDLVLEGYEEHAVARFALRRLLKTHSSDQTFKAKVMTLMEIVDHHIKEEESELFPAAEKLLGEGSAALGAKMKELFATTSAAGYEHTVGRGGPAITSSKAPKVAHA